MKKYSKIVCVGTRSRVTIPFDFWAEARMKSLRIEVNPPKLPQYRCDDCPGGYHCFNKEFFPGVGMQVGLSYRVAVPMFNPGDKVELVADRKNHQIIINALQ